MIFVPVAYMEDEMPLPHETHLVERGVRNPTLDWGLMRELDAGGVRVESHGIAHRPLAEVSPRRGGARDRGLEARSSRSSSAARCARTPT